MGEGIIEKKNIVVSGINFFEGGPLSLIKDILHFLDESEYIETFNIFAFVSKLDYYQDIQLKHVQLVEFPTARQSYRKRLYFEYRYFFEVSKDLKPYLWFSLHDITPNVLADRQVVYCHNPAPFYKATFHEFLLEPKFAFFNKLYRLVYWKNIRRNAFIVVQQNWLREKFSTIFSIDKKKIIVAHPNTEGSFGGASSAADKKTFIYPAFPRVFKNIELLAESAALLENRMVSNFEIILTIDGTENRYSRWLKKKYSHLSSLKFIGKQPRDQIFKLYSKADCLVFPSKLETWGLPISEFKKTGKPVWLADLPYAHETVGTYGHVLFFDPSSPTDLAIKMEKFIAQNQILTKPAIEEVIDPPMARNWSELFAIILSKEV